MAASEILPQLGFSPFARQATRDSAALVQSADTTESDFTRIIRAITSGLPVTRQFDLFLAGIVYPRSDLRILAAGDQPTASHLHQKKR